MTQTPPPQFSASNASSHSQQHNHSRIYIGPLSLTGPASRASRASGAGSADEADNDGLDTRRRKRDLLRRRKRSASGAGGDTWAETPTVGRGFRRREGSAADTIWADDDDDDLQGLGWWIIKWEGTRKKQRRGSKSSTLRPGSSCVPPAMDLRSARPENPFNPSPLLGQPLVSSPSQSLGSAAATSSYLHSTSPPRPSYTTRASTGVDSFVTARSTITPSLSIADRKGKGRMPIPEPQSDLSVHTSPLPAGTSSAPLFSRQESDSTLRPAQLARTQLPTFHHTAPSPRPSLDETPPASIRAVRSALRKPKDVPKEAATVHFPMSRSASNFFRRELDPPAVVDEEGETAESIPGDLPPAPPTEVLQRDAAPEIGALPVVGSTEQEDVASEVDFGVDDVVMRDRMLVKIQYSRSPSLPPDYDEVGQRRSPADRSERWEEKLVVFRRRRVEIWDDFSVSIRGKDKKKLKHIIILDPKDTSISLYSLIDNTFCITTPPTRLTEKSATASRSFTSTSQGHRARAKARLRVLRSDPGTNIFLFNPKTATRSVDWMWEIWLQLHGPEALPDRIDITVPGLNNARISVDIPTLGTDLDQVDSVGKITRTVTRQKLIELCLRELKTVPTWQQLLESFSDAGESSGDLAHKIGLAWRKGDRLDWVWTDVDVLGKPRDWGVLAGMGPLKQMRHPATLELRIARHANAVLHLPSGEVLTEPPAVEGHLIRYKLKTGRPNKIYIASHDGCLFICQPSKSHPPSIDSAPLAARSPDSKEARTFGQFKSDERCRAVMQITGAEGLVDLRSIVDVRRQNSTRSSAHPSSAAGDEDEDGWESLSEDEQDAGGDQGLRAHSGHARQDLKKGRTFQVEFDTGEVQTFETHSRLAAREWVDRLNDLRIYWQRKHEQDAKHEMEVSGTRKIHAPKIVAGRIQEPMELPESAIDPDEPGLFIDEIWNWCVIDDCRPITKMGKLFSKRPKRQYRAHINVLTHGHLIQFNLHQDEPYRSRVHRYSLIDAYVYSGLLAQEELPRSSNEDAWTGEPRFYADGFQSADGSEDTCLVLWYRPHLTTTSASKLGHAIEADKDYVPPKLGTTGHKKLVLRARSRLERDTWAWAIGMEVERLARRRKVREDRIRAAGDVDHLN